MSTEGAIPEPWAAALDRRAAALARRLESHPARHLLAEYEAVFLDRRPCVARPAEDAGAGQLLARMDAAIAALDREAARLEAWSTGDCGVP